MATIKDNSMESGAGMSPKATQDPVKDPLLTSQISVQDAKRALLRSGYLLEHRVEILFRSRAWYVEANSAYPDPETSKSRELDIYALRMVDHQDESGDAVFVSIVAECVNNPQPIAFITKEDKYFDFSRDIKIVSDPMEVQESGGKTSIVDFLELYDTHHYCKGRIATQFCSFTRKKEPKAEWMALHEDRQFDSLMSLIKALEYKKSSFGLVEGTQLITELIYPVLVLQGELLDVRVAGDDLELRQVDHLKYRRSVIWGLKETGYVVDVVTEKGLKDFEHMISEEMDSIAGKVRLRSEILRENITHKPKRPKPSSNLPS